MGSSIPVLEANIIAAGANPTIQVSPSFDDSFKNKNNFNTDAQMADVALGIRWEKATTSERFCFALWAGYEQNIFFAQNRFTNFQNDFTIIGIPNSPLGNALGSQEEGPNFFTDRGNLVTSGVSGGMEFGF